MTQQNPSLPSRQVIAPPRPAHATDRYDGPTALYRLYDADGQLLYIGITCNPPQRWEGHRQKSTWWKLVARKELTTYPDRSAALTAEVAAIRAERPIHNIASHPGKPSRHVHLVLTEKRAEKLRALAKLRKRGLSNTMYELLDEVDLPAERPVPEPSDLAVAIELARRMLATANDVGLREAVRILLRAVDEDEKGWETAPTPVDEQAAARRSVDAQFPVVAAFLASERGEGQ